MATLLARNALRSAPKRNSLISVQRRFLNNGACSWQRVQRVVEKPFGRRHKADCLTSRAGWLRGCRAAWHIHRRFFRCTSPLLLAASCAYTSAASRYPLTQTSCTSPAASARALEMPRIADAAAPCIATQHAAGTSPSTQQTQTRR